MSDLSQLAMAAIGTVPDPAAGAATPTAVVSPVVLDLFKLLHGAYGSGFLSKFSTGNLDAKGRDRGVRSAMVVWQAALAKFPDDVLRTAAERVQAEHPKFAPNLPEFEALCRAAMPRKTYAQEHGLPRLAAPAHAAAAGSSAAFESRNDGRDWARSILANHRAGFKKTPTVLQMACDALGMEVA